MDLEAVFAMADNIARPATDPLGFHDANDHILGVASSFFPVTQGQTFVQQSNPSTLIDSDDDFGEFTSVPAESVHAMDASVNSDPFGFPANTSFKPDVEDSFDMFGFHTASSHPQMSPAQEDLFWHLPATGESLADPDRTASTASPSIPIETNSDDDWGDFVENSTSAAWANSSDLDCLNTSQQNVGESMSVESAPSKVDGSSAAWESEVWSGPPQEEVPKFEQKDANLEFSDLGFFDGGKMPSTNNSKALPSSKDSKTWSEEPQIIEGFSSSNEEMAVQEKPALKRTLSDQRIGRNATSLAPIPLSLFGETEIEVENSNAELPEPVTKLFQGHSRSKARSAGSFTSNGTTSLSDIISSLYMDSQPNLQMKNPPVMDTVNSNKIVDNNSAVIVEDRNRSLEERVFSLSLSLENAVDLSSSKGSMDIFAGPDVQSPEATCFELLDSISTDDRCIFVKAWASMSAICASELELALNIWKQAQEADARLELLADLQGKEYFAAIGQVYVVALILATASNFYKPWLRLLSKEAESLQADLQRCKAVWLQNNLKEGVHLALDGLQGLMSSSVVTWEGIDGFAALALEAFFQAPKASMHSICKLSLLPMASFACVPPVEWVGSSYLLPLANMWVNCVSNEPPETSLTTQPKRL